MMSVHYPGSEQIEGASTYNAPRLNWDEGLSFRFLTAERIAKFISSFDAYKSPSGDMASPVILQRAGNTLIEIMVQLFRASLRLSSGYLVQSESRFYP